MSNNEAYNDLVVSAALDKCHSSLFISYAEALASIVCAMEKDTEEKRTYKLLHDLCFSPIQSGVARAISPVSDEDIRRLILIEHLISNAKLHALVLDNIWTFGRTLAGKNAFDYAIRAIALYSSEELTEQAWFGAELSRSVERALRIALSLGNCSNEEITSLKRKLAQKYASSVAADPSSPFIYWIPRILLSVRTKEIIPPDTIVQNFFRYAEKVGDEHEIQWALTDAIQWCNFVGNKELCAKAHKELSRSYRREADAEASKIDVSWLRAAHFYDLAYAELLKITNDLRDDDTPENLLELSQKSDAAYQQSMSQMHSVRLPQFDMSQEVRKAEAVVTGIEAEHALRNFCLLLPITELDAQAYADGMLKGGVLASLFGKTVLSAGAKPRVVGSVPGLPNDKTSADYAKRYWCEKIAGVSAIIAIYFQARLYPAFCILKKEHDLNLDYFKKLVTNAPLVPQNHKRIFAEALALGYSEKFTLAAYVLAPEVENIVRCALNNVNVCTTSNQDGVLQEKGLSRLVEEQKLTALFGADFVFVLKAIFTDHLGPNVRNETAHGLKDDASFDSYIDFYVWWFALSLVFYTHREVS